MEMLGPAVMGGVPKNHDTSAPPGLDSTEDATGILQARFLQDLQPQSCHPDTL